MTATQNNSRNIIILSQNVNHATKVANHLCKEYGFIRARINSQKASADKYIVSICSEIVDYDRLNKFGYIVDLASQDQQDYELAAGNIFDMACDHFMSEVSVEEVSKICA